MLESVQRRATKIPSMLKNLKYAERLKALNLTTLTERRRRGDLIQFFKIVKGIERVDLNSKLNLMVENRNNMNTRGHNLRYVKQCFSARSINDNCAAVNIRRNFFEN